MEFLVLSFVPLHLREKNEFEEGVSQGTEVFSE